MGIDGLRENIQRALSAAAEPTGAAVLIPLVNTPEGPAVLLEVRALTIDIQPGEVCLPGGHLEAGETPHEAAVRETCEELLVDASQIEILGSLGCQRGPSGKPLHVFVGLLSNYEGTFSPDEVGSTFTLQLDWLLSNDPTRYDVVLEPHHPDDFPWELIPGGRDYPWHVSHSQTPFYLGTDPLIWGATARVLARFAQVMRSSLPPQQHR